MIYLDNAATTYPKPPQVYREWSAAMRSAGANPGRGGYPFSAAASESVYTARERCAELFGASPENTVFTLNCTQAVNLAVKGLAKRGAHYVISDIEHNAVLRPIHAAATANGGSYSIFETDEDEDITLARADRAITADTCAMVCTAASNVTGRRLPIKALAGICKKHGVPLIVDAAQGAGALPLDVNMGVNIICCAGHKGLYGPMGTGLMITDGSISLKTIMEGGTGSASESPIMPDFMPDRFESGTINTAGVIALGSGADFVRTIKPEVILKHELDLCELFCEGLRRIEGIKLYADINRHNRSGYVPVVAFNIKDVHSSDASGMLGRLGICMRGGLHCAPLAHRKLGTTEQGAVRFSPSAFTSVPDVEQALKAVRKAATDK